jgi:NitT/TauT family transport system substrate-binding protein
MMPSTFRPALRVLLLALLAAAFATPALARDIRLALQATGTAKWELAAMQELGLDKAHDLDIEIRDVADSRAGQIALQAGEADIILSDFVWVSLQRAAGNMVTLVPHSLTVGGLMVDPAAGIARLNDLTGKTIAVSGSPADKSYVALAAAYMQATGTVLSEDADIRFGAPPLVNEMLMAGQAQATLNLWNWNARAKLAGYTEFVTVPAMLTDLGIATTPPLLGWTFFDTVDADKQAAIAGFLAASSETKTALLADDTLWDRIRPAMNVDADDALFSQLRDDYRKGIVQTYGLEAVAAAAQYFELISRFGALDGVSDATALAPGTFWEGFAK